MFLTQLSRRLPLEEQKTGHDPNVISFQINWYISGCIVRIVSSSANFLLTDQCVSASSFRSSVDPPLLFLCRYYTYFHKISKLKDKIQIT